MITWLTGDVFDGLATLEDGSVDLVVTSPPFLALRSYLPADHPDKGKEIGSEATPAAFLDVMLKVTAELGRVLAPHGSIAIELGDTYAGGGAVDNRADENGLIRRKPYEDQPTFNRGSGAGVPTVGDGWPLAKSKTLIPELFRIALAYGFNPLTGEPSPAGRWRVRNVVTWCRPNPPVGALGDKWRPATSDIVVACVSDKRYWDDLATRRAFKYGENGGGSGLTDDGAGNIGRRLPERRMTHSGAPLLDYWEIPPTGYAGAHYAVYPPALVEPLAKAMCPSRVCRTCGEPSRRITDTTLVTDDGIPTTQALTYVDGTRNTKGNYRPGHVRNDVLTLGFTDCGHDDWRPGLILDPFAGSGTTLAVASGHGHDTIGIDLDPRNEELARERVGPLLWQDA